MSKEPRLFPEHACGLRAVHSPDEGEQVQVGCSRRIYLGARQEAIVEKVARGGQDAVQSEEIAEALECPMNCRLTFQLPQRFCEALHSHVVAVCLRGHQGALASGP